jgi:hypothetical protein
MRAILLILILGIVALIAVVATGLVDIEGVSRRQDARRRPNRQRRGCQGRQAPAFDIETGSVAVGTREANVAVPLPKYG